MSSETERSTVNCREREREREREDGDWVLGFGDNGQSYGNQPATSWLQGYCLEQNPLQGTIFLLLLFILFVL